MSEMNVFSRLVGLAYDAALTPSAWVDFLRVTTEHFGAMGAQIVYADHRRQELTINIHYGFSDEVMQTYERLAFDDPLTPHVIENKNAVVHHVFSELPEQMKKTAFIQEAIFSNDIQERIAFVSEVSQDETLGFGVLISDGRPRMSVADIDFVRQLQPHIMRSIEIHREIAKLSYEKERHKNIMDALPIGVVILDLDAQIIIENSAALDITSDKDLFRRTNGCVQILQDQADREFRDLVAQAATQELHEAKSVRVDLKNRNDSIFLTVVPADACSVMPEIRVPHETAATVYLFDPRIKVESSERLLARIFGLTMSEARTMLKLVQGATTEEIAAAQEISIETVRTYLKRIFQKTGARRQADVVRIGTNSPAWIKHQSSTTVGD